LIFTVKRRQYTKDSSLMKVKAATIPELITVIIVSSLLTVSIWNAYEFVITRFYQFETINQKYLTVIELDRCLSNDFLKSTTITYSHGKTLNITLYNEEVITYEFNEGLAVRKHNQNIRYFFVDVSSKGVSYRNGMNKDTLLVHKLYLELSLNKRNWALTYVKHYDAFSLINEYE